MTLKMEQLKEKMKFDYAKKVDEYFTQCEELKKGGRFDINGIEILLGNGINAAKEVLVETMEDMMKQQAEIETNASSKKKHVFAEKH